jgi:hypothetical protein
MQLSWWMVLRGVLGVLAVLAFVSVFALVEQRHVLTQPDETGRVIRAEPVGRIGSGRTSCDGARFRVRIDRPRADLRERDASFTACQSDYRTGEEMVLRRVPGRPDRTVDSPLGVLDVVVGVSLLATAGAVLLGIGWVVLEAWREYRRRRRGGRGRIGLGKRIRRRLVSGYRG